MREYYLKTLLKSGRIVKIGADIHGGQYKFLYSEYDEDKDKEVYNEYTAKVIRVLNPDWIIK